ncbi:MAG: thioredoxin family protein [Candidatus Bipolaricaulaceae bacterium]
MTLKTALGVLVVGLGFVLSAGAAQVELHYFWSATCPDCQLMWEFLRGLQEQHPQLSIVDYEVAFSPNDWRLMVSLAREFGLEKVTTPTVIVGELAVSGVGRAVELRIREEVERCLEQACPSPMARLPKERAAVLSPLEILAVLALGALIVLYLAG